MPNRIRPQKTRPMRTPPLVAACFAWHRLGLHWLQMAAASGEAFAHRTGRRNSPAQLLQMGTEKVAASLESSGAVARHMLSLPPSNPLAMWSAWIALATSAMTPYRVRAVRNARSARRSR